MLFLQVSNDPRVAAAKAEAEAKKAEAGPKIEEVD
jgi:hypothetical protein